MNGRPQSPESRQARSVSPSRVLSVVFLSLGKAGRGGIGAPRVGAKEEVALKGDETGERREITGEKSGERMFQIARHEVPKH